MTVLLRGCGVYMKSQVNAIIDYSEVSLINQPVQEIFELVNVQKMLQACHL